MNVPSNLGRVLIVFFFAACSSTVVGSAATPGSSYARPTEASALLAEAEALFAKSRQLDYRAPMNRARSELADSATRKFWAACLAGATSACWRMQATGFSNSTLVWVEHEAMLQAGRNCLEGDKPSCVVLMGRAAGKMLSIQKDSADAYIDACANGDTGSCGRAEVVKRCVVLDLQSEDCREARVAPPTSAARVRVANMCDRGLAPACRVLAASREEGVSSDQVAAYAARACALHDGLGCDLAATFARASGNAGDAAYFTAQRDGALRAECAAGAPEACERSGDPSAEAVATRACDTGFLAACEQAHSAHGLESLCTASGYWCDKLAALRDPVSSLYRDALEHGCQRRDLGACAGLVDGYEGRRWLEPVAGRAGELTRLVCADSIYGETMWRERHCGGTGKPPGGPIPGSLP